MASREGDQVNATIPIQDHINDIDDMNMDLQNAHDLLSGMDPTTETGVINCVDNAFKRNKLSSFLTKIRENLDGVKIVMVDRIITDIVEEDIRDVLEMVKPYNRLIVSILDLPDGAVTDQQLKDFIATHKDENKSLYEEVRSLKLKVERLVTMEVIRYGNIQPGSGVHLLIPL